MKRRLGQADSVRRFLTFVNGSVEDALASAGAGLASDDEPDVTAVHERANALMSLLADVSAKKWQHPPPWDLDVKTASAGRLTEMRWYGEEVTQALDLAEQFVEENTVLQRSPAEATAHEPMREAVELLVVNTFYSHVLVMRCAWAECGNWTIEDRNVRDPQLHRRYCSPDCEKAADNDKRKGGGYWKEGKKCVREVNETNVDD